MAKVLILGGGFAAIAAAETLSNVLDGTDEIMLVSPSHDFVFYPALVPLIFGDFDLREIHFDLRPKLAERNIKFVEGKVTGFDTRSQTVLVESDRAAKEIDYDYLLVTIGRRLATETIPGFFRYAHHLLNIESALKFKNEISGFAAGSIVVGLCPDSYLPVPVCETALALAGRFEQEIADGKVTVTAVFPSTLDQAFAGSALFRDIEDEFERRGIRLVSDFAVERVHEDKIISALGSSLNYDLLMLVPPFQGQFALMQQAQMTDDAGFTKVNSLMKIAGQDRIYAAGDIVSMPGPRFGYMAMRQGKVAAANILSELRGEEPTVEYSHEIAWAIGEKYTDPVFFHYGFWDNTLNDFDENALFGMAKPIRKHYGLVGPEDVPANIAAVI